MELSYNDIFKYSDIFNPISQSVLFSAGKLAKMNTKKIILDLGSGKGFPSLLWASVFGVQVEGVDVEKKYVEYANSRAKALNLSNRVKYICKDIKQFRVTRKYDVIASLGLGVTQVYGDTDNAFKKIKSMLYASGFLIFAEPVWRIKKVPSKVLQDLSISKEQFLTKFELQRLMEKNGFRVKGSFVSSKEDWEFYIKPIYIAMQEIIESKSKLAKEAQKILDSFNAEYEAVGKYWDMILWVIKS
jgi:cyclopropane fatty-acyl-phospholipid synthase-like methyltransferase